MQVQLEDGEFNVQPFRGRYNRLRMLVLLGPANAQAWQCSGCFPTTPPSFLLLLPEFGLRGSSAPAERQRTQICARDVLTESQSSHSGSCVLRAVAVVMLRSQTGGVCSF